VVAADAEEEDEEKAATAEGSNENTCFSVEGVDKALLLVFDGGEWGSCC
jgi:hypothetical protein